MTARHAYLARLQRSKQVGFVDDTSTSSVDDEHTVLALRQRRRVDEVLRVLAARGVQRDDVSLGQQGIKGHLQR